MNKIEEIVIPKGRRVLSGIKTTRLHLGHMFSIVRLADVHKAHGDLLIMIGDYHRYSSSYDTEKINEESQGLYNVFANLGVKPYIQSVFDEMYGSCFFKFAHFIQCNHLDKLLGINYSNSTENNCAKYIYPALMLLDILLVQPCTVIVAQDQIHNVRFCKSNIEKLNNAFNINIDVDFQLLDINILGFHSDHTGKMSTSVNAGIVYVDDTLETVRSVIAHAATADHMCQTMEEFNSMNANVRNLYNVYQLVSDLTVEQIVVKYADKGYEELKADLSALVHKYISRFNALRQKQASVSYDSEILALMKQNKKVLSTLL